MSVSSQTWVGGCGSDTRCAQCGRYIGGSDTTWTSSFGGGTYCSRRCAEEYDNARQKQLDEAIQSDKKFYNGYLKSKTTLKTRFVGGLFSFVLLAMVLGFLTYDEILPPAFALVKANSAARFGFSFTFMGIVELLLCFFVGFALPKVFLWFSKVFSIFSRLMNGK